MTDARIEAGTLFLGEQPRTLAGVLLPYNEPGRTNLGAIKGVKPSAVPVPGDLTGLGANLDHDREQPVAAFTDARDTAVGLFATFRVQDSPAGDALLADAALPAEQRKYGRLSAEVADIEIRDGWIVSGRLFGGAFVGRGAFPSAALLAQDTGPDSPAPRATLKGADMSETPPEPDAPDPAPEPDQPDTPESVAAPVFAMVPANAPALMASARPTTTPAPSLMAAAAPVPGAARPPVTVRPRGSSIQQVAYALAGYFANRDPRALEALSPEDRGASTLFAALSDITYSGPGAAGENLQVPQWLGKVWDERTYIQRAVPHFTPGELTSLEVRGWDWLIPPQGGTWQGNKNPIPSNAPTTQPLDAAARRWAMGHDHAREYLDFPQPGYWESYFQAGTDDFARWEDDGCLDAAVSAATPIAGGAPPATWSGDGATVAIVDGALYLIGQGILPTVAFVASDLYRGLLLQNDNKVIETLELSLNLEEGSLEGFALVPVPAVELDGTTATPMAGKVLVGNRGALRHLRLPGVPIRTDALDMVKGGIDTAMFGYTADLVVKPSALALVTPDDGVPLRARSTSSK